MTGREQLRELRAQRDHELRAATLSYAHLKRDVQRTLSPDRIIRSHLGVSLAIAAVGGMLLAPAPRYEKKKKRSGRLKNSLFSVIRRIPGLSQNIPGLEALLQSPPSPPATSREPPENIPTQPPSPLSIGFLGSILSVILPQMDWPKIVAGFMSGLREGASLPPTENPEPPSVAVADVGTQPASQPLNGRLGQMD